MQIFFVNSRYIKSQIISVALEKAYKGSILTGKFPSAVLYLTLSPKTTDINVHPTKTEVKFLDEHKIFEAVYYSVKSALQKDQSKEEIKFDIHTKEKEILKIDKIDENKKELTSKQEKIIENNGVENLKSNFNFIDFDDEPEIYMPKRVDIRKNPKLIDGYKNIVKNKELDIENEKLKNEVIELKKENSELTISKQPIFENFKSERPIKFIGEVFSTYIIMQKDDEIIFIDKHAAHERLIFEKLKKNKEGDFLQALLLPVKILLDSSDYDIVLQNLDLLYEAGFDTSDFGDGMVLVRTVPLILADYNVEDIFLSCVETLVLPSSNDKSEMLDNLYHSMACKSAIKANDINSDEELIELAKRVFVEENIDYCPHGRPISIILTKKEIEKKFKRT